MGKYLDKIRQHEQGEPAPPIETGQAAFLPTIEAGSRITWTRADGTIQQGVVDFLHLDPHGQQWAFVSLGETWAAVNCKFVKV